MPDCFLSRGALVRRPVLPVTCIFLLVLTLPLLAAAQRSRNRPPFLGEQWVQLFNGKDLSGWVEVGKEKWTVEDGVIHGQSVSDA
jgi:hypothetical protein